MGLPALAVILGCGMRAPTASHSPETGGAYQTVPPLLFSALCQVRPPSVLRRIQPHGRGQAGTVGGKGCGC